jgi:hypothetical protein
MVQPQKNIAALWYGAQIQEAERLLGARHYYGAAQVLVGVLSKVPGDSRAQYLLAVARANLERQRVDGAPILPTDTPRRDPRRLPLFAALLGLLAGVAAGVSSLWVPMIHATVEWFSRVYQEILQKASELL